ncbi:hypothetical protein J8M20_03030 [Pseudoalteromonas luteoviolacea]|uniref:hypothetical protein n=1 Tax=Pseudoalteromonas luteoviolacea TaxID=43657 RepID=UPI001B38803B|nr:hypothetical protein [Pseudoalteromonas luteoviolacea]MBQ4810289.1 hypothetical protein [Pseudoalteromonas luteoviolacea]
MRIVIFVVTLMFPLSVVGAQLEHPIKVSWFESSKTISKVNTPRKVVIQNIIYSVSVSAVVKERKKYYVVYYCSSEKVNQNGEIVGLYAGEIDVVSIFQTKSVEIGCGFKHVLELSLANKSIKSDA